MSTFTLEDHGEENLVLAMEPSKLLGYRDSHILFQKHSQLKRVRITDDERQHLIDTGLLITRFKNPEVAVVTARSLYKTFGHRVIVNGQRIKDDYFESNPERHIIFSSTANTHPKVVEEVNKIDDDIDDNSRRSLIGKTTKSEGYNSSVPLTNQTWMHHAALATRGYNSQLHERRAEKPTFYDIHSNINQVPASYQATDYRFELSNDNNPKPIEFNNTVNRTAQFGLARCLLDDDIESVINELTTEQERAHITSFLPRQERIVDFQSSTQDDNYPLSLMEGQHQTAFPL